MDPVNEGLEIRGLSVQFGGLKAVSNLDLYVRPGELVGLIGPNGAGKTTVFNALTGLCRISEGEVCFNQMNLTNQSTHSIATRGVARTFQNIRLFKALTVADNLRIAYHQHCRYNILSGILRQGVYHQAEATIRESIKEALDITRLTQRVQEKASNLSYGEQRRLEVARALVMRPQLLLLDEPAAGMNPFETQELVDLIRRIREQFHLTVLLIEHDMSLVMRLCERLYVLDYGLLIAEGPVDEVRQDRRVIEAYLGEDVAQ